MAWTFKRWPFISLTLSNKWLALHTVSMVHWFTSESNKPTSTLKWGATCWACHEIPPSKALNWVFSTSSVGDCLSFFLHARKLMYLRFSTFFLGHGEKNQNVVQPESHIWQTFGVPNPPIWIAAGSPPRCPRLFFIARNKKSVKWYLYGFSPQGHTPSNKDRTKFGGVRWFGKTGAPNHQPAACLFDTRDGFRSQAHKSLDKECRKGHQGTALTALWLRSHRPSASWSGH